MLDKPNAVLVQRLGSKGVLPVEQARHQQVPKPPQLAVGLGAGDRGTQGYAAAIGRLQANFEVFATSSSPLTRRMKGFH
jgi:hypothetical protein